MKRPTNLILLSVLLLAGITLLGSCNEENNSGPTIFYSDIVSCHLNNDSSVYFEQILSDDRGSIILQPDEPVVNKEIRENQRVLLQYLVNSTPTDSLYNISATYISAIRYDSIAHAPADSIASYPNDLVRINSLWRTGGYINFDISLEYYYPYPQTRPLLQSQPNGGRYARRNTTTRPQQRLPRILDTNIASFYIPEVLQPEYKAIRIHANTP